MKEDLTLRLFKIYNDTVFDNQVTTCCMTGGRSAISSCMVIPARK